MSGPMTDDDLFGQSAPPISSAAPPLPSVPAPLPVDTDARLIARAAVAEGDPDNPQSYQNIAGVIYNRMQKSGKSAADVLSEPGQFEAYQNGHIQGVDPSSPQFATALQAAQPVLAGQVHVPFDSFYQPDIVAQRGVKAPFDPATGTKIGTQVFGNGYGATGFALTPQQAADWDRLTAVDPGITDASTKQPLTNPAQVQAARDAQARGELDAKATPGSTANPFYAKPGDDLSQVPQGGFYWDTAGHLQVNAPVSNPLLYGLQHGVNVIPATLGQAMSPLARIGDNPAAVSELNAANAHNALTTGQFNRYATTGDAAVGNALGQTGAAIPLAMTGEGALADLGPVGEFLAGRGGTNLLTRLGSQAVGGAIQGGGTAAALSSAQPDVPLATQVEQGVITGGVAGPVLPLAAKGVGLGLNSLVGDSSVSPAVSDLADKAINQYGIPLSKPQVLAAAGDRASGVTWSNMLSEPGSGMMQNFQAQKQAFTKAVAGTFGEDADALTPQALQGARSRIGGVFNRVAENTNIANTDPLLTQLGSVVHDAQQVLPDTEVAPLLKQVENIGSTIQDGQLSGSSYQALTRSGSALDRAQNSSNPNIRYYAGQIRDALDDALEQHASPQDLGDLQNARWQYKNLMTIKDLAAKAGVEGTISPALLNGAVNTSFKNRAFSGAGDLGDLAQIGQAFLKEPPNSGSAARAADMLKRNILPLGLEGGALAATMHDPGLALKLGAAGAVAGGMKLGSNMLYGAMNGPGAANALIRGPGPVGQLLQGGGDLARRIAQGAYVPASVAYNRLAIPTGQPVEGAP